MAGGRAAGLAANLALAAAAVGIALLLLAGLEVGLRLAGTGDPEPWHSKLRYQQLRVPLLVPGQDADGAAVLRSVDPRLPYQSIRAAKPGGGLRILCFGGSATAGLGFSPNMSFPRYLERMLRASNPQRALEVLNLGIVALASRQVASLVEEASRAYEPDWLVVYSGNNEFLELHAEKYHRANAGWARRLRRRLGETNLYRLLDRALRASRRAAPLDEEALARDELRLPESALIRDLATSPEEIARVVEHYEANLERMVAAARGAGVPITLMTVASNWRWRGREDPPAEWSGDVPQALEQGLAEAEAAERAELLYRSARAWEAAGDAEKARERYRAAMNADPHLRRALDAMNERVRAVARRHGLPVVDAVEVLASDAPGRIVGFEAFYDYVHFTPRGALQVAGALYDESLRLGLWSPERPFAWRRFADRELRRIDAARHDELAVDRWLGFAFDPSLIGDRDLWKYERMRRDLDARIEADPGAFRARVYRGNAAYFEPDGAPAAERDWSAALERAPGEAAIRENLARLRAEGRSAPVK